MSLNIETTPASGINVLTLRSESTYKLTDFSSQLERHERDAQSALTRILTLEAEQIFIVDWSQSSEAIQERRNLLASKKLLQKHFEDVKIEVLTLKKNYDKVAKQFDEWFQERTNEVQKIHDKAEQTMIDFEELIHAHTSQGTLSNVGFTGMTWQQYELVARLKRMGADAQSNVIWGKREVVLTEGTRKNVYDRFLVDFKNELETDKLALLPIRMPGVTKSTAKSHYLLPQVLEMLSPSPYQANNTQLFPSLSLIYQAYLKHDALKALFEANEELSFYADKGWVSDYAMLWQDAKLTHRALEQESERERQKLLNDKILTREAIEHIQRENLVKEDKAMKEPLPAGSKTK